MQELLHDSDESGGERKDQPKTARLLRLLIFLSLLLLAATVALSCVVYKLLSEKTLWGMYEGVLRQSKFIDLTHSFSPTVPLWEGFGEPTIKAGVAGKAVPDFASVGEEFSYAKHGFVTTSYVLTTDQLGTQLDPPAHWNELGATISDLPATVSVRPLVIIDTHEKVAADPSYSASRSDCEAWEAAHGKIPAGSVVFFRSDWSKSWHNESAAQSPIPSVGLDALKFLHLERSILFHGHEPLDTDSTPNLEGEAWLMHNDFAQAEGVTNLHLVAEQGCLVAVGFAKALHGSGGYARYVAICPASHPHGTTIDESSGAPLPRQSAPLRRGADGVLQPTPGATPTQYCATKTSLGCANGSLVQ